jgi:uncharacterized membrane protein
MNGTKTRPVESYLKRLDRSMRNLPPARRDEILDEVAEHIDESLAEIESPTEADVRNVLDRVGDPEEIAAEARQRFGIQPAQRRGTDIAAIPLLLLGGFTVVGWFIGLVLLWISDVWTVRDKVIGTLIIPGGLAVSLGFVFLMPAPAVKCPVTQSAVSCVNGSAPLGPVETGLLLLLAIAPILTALYLGFRLAKRSS